MNCGYCGDSAVYRSMGCFGCNIWHEYGTSVSIERWKNLIEELADLECYSLTITGGDLSQVHDSLEEITRYAYGKIPKITIIVNEHNFSKIDPESIDKYAKLVIQTSEIRELMDGYIYLHTSDKHHTPKDEENTHSQIMKEFIYNDSENFMKVDTYSGKGKIAKIPLYQFFHNLEFHPCIGKSLAFTWRGDILPCIMMRDQVLGNLHEQELYSIFADSGKKVNRYWNLNLDHVNRCKQCEFRYACGDCRALEAKITGKIDNKGACRYDPETGEWA